MLGSIVIQAKIDAGLSIYTVRRSDETIRYKLMFSKLRHAAPMPPMEIVRFGGEDSFKWEARDWNDDANPKVDSIYDCLAVKFKGAASADELTKALAMPRPTFYRKIKSLERNGEVVKKGNIYYLPGRSAEINDQ